MSGRSQPPAPRTTIGVICSLQDPYPNILLIASRTIGPGGRRCGLPHHDPSWARPASSPPVRISTWTEDRGCAIFRSVGAVYVVRQGDHLPKIATAHGHGDYAEIWDAPENAELRQTRDPCVLAPGDQVQIPPKQSLSRPVATGKKNTFILKRPKIKLRLVLRDASDQPIADAACSLTCNGATFKLQSDADGRIEQDIPVETDTCMLKCCDEELELRVGYLDPIEQPSGWRGRLNNLGYDAGESDDAEDPALRSAIEEFQCDHMGPQAVDGICGPETQAKLKQVHGS
jgi:hypothetical protein